MHFVESRRFRSLIPSYIRDSSMAIIVYDISSERSFGNVHLWYDDVKQQRDDIEVVIVGNKSDLEGKRLQKGRVMNSSVIPTEPGTDTGKGAGLPVRGNVGEVRDERGHDLQGAADPPAHEAGAPAGRRAGSVWNKKQM